MLARGGNRYNQALPEDTVPLTALRETFDTRHQSADWRQHYYWHPRHGLRDVIVPGYWRSVCSNIHPGDSIRCELGALGERTIVELGVLAVSEKAAEVSIIRRDKETRVAAAHFEDPPKAKGKAA